MCLTNLSYKNDDPTDDNWNIGYKVIEINSRGYKFAPYLETKYSYPNSIITTKDFLQGKDSYICGFHIWISIKSARRNLAFFNTMKYRAFELWKVKYRRTTAMGFASIGATNERAVAVSSLEMSFIEKV